VDEDIKDQWHLSPMAGRHTNKDWRWAESRQERGQMLTGCYLYGVSLPPSVSSTTCTRTVYANAKDKYESLWTRFVNHASPPRNNVNPKSIHESCNGRPCAWFVAKWDIKPGNKICFNYGNDFCLEGDNVV
jgi:hypothetical protein